MQDPAGLRHQPRQPRRPPAAHRPAARRHGLQGGDRRAHLSAGELPLREARVRRDQAHRHLYRPDAGAMREGAPRDRDARRARRVLRDRGRDGRKEKMGETLRTAPLTRVVVPPPCRGLDMSAGYGWVQSTAIRAGDYLFVSGVVAIAPERGARLNGPPAPDTHRASPERHQVAATAGLYLE